MTVLMGRGRLRVTRWGDKLGDGWAGTAGRAGAGGAWSAETGPAVKIPLGCSDDPWTGQTDSGRVEPHWGQNVGKGAPRQGRAFWGPSDATLAPARPPS